MRKTPTAELDSYAYDMLLFYMQERNIDINDIDHLEVELCKDKKTRTYYRNIKIIFYDRTRKNKISARHLRNKNERGISRILRYVSKFFALLRTAFRS